MFHASLTQSLPPCYLGDPSSEYDGGRVTGEQHQDYYSLRSSRFGAPAILSLYRLFNLWLSHATGAPRFLLGFENLCLSAS